MASLVARDIMTSPAVTVGEDTSLRETARTMLSHRIGSVLVTDANGAFLGLMTDDDFTAERVPLPFSAVAAARALGHWLSKGGLKEAYRAEAGSPVREFMVSPVPTVAEETPVEEVVSIMLDRSVAHVPVVRDGRPVGVITRRNLLQFLFDEVVPRS